MSVAICFQEVLSRIWWMQNSQKRRSVAVQTPSYRPDQCSSKDTSDVIIPRQFRLREPFKVSFQHYKLPIEKFSTDDNIAKLEAEVHSARQGLMPSAELAQNVCTNTLRCVSIFDTKSVEASFVEYAIHSICNTLYDWWFKHLYASLERPSWIT